ncbi:hypothetical protein FRC06_004160 [Ceratobasidium sp. 370]|nr:hypothetical protein FRC06_004160 [Ceratobasidium sp. 370]
MDYAITDNQFVSMDNDDFWRSYLTYANTILDKVDPFRLDFNAGVSVAIFTMQFCHWKSTYRLAASHQREVVEQANHILLRQLEPAPFEPGRGRLSSTTLFRLVESTAHYLVGVWPREESSKRSSILPILLARIFLEYHNTIPDVARGAAVTLAATAFATRSYPGGEVPSDTVDSREKRAVHVWKYHQVHTPDKDTTLELFVFGLFGILPELRLLDETTQHVALPYYFDNIFQRMPRLDLDREPEVFTLLRNYSLSETVFVPALRCLSSVASGEPSPGPGGYRV